MNAAIAIFQKGGIHNLHVSGKSPEEFKPTSNRTYKS